MKRMGQIEFFSWLLAILLLLFFLVGIHFCSKDLNSKNEHNLGKERVTDTQEGQ